MAKFDNENVLDIISTAYDNDISISLEDDKLKLKLRNKDTYDEDLIEAIREHKEKIISFLQNEQTNVNTTSGAAQKISKYRKETYGRIPLSSAQQRLWFIDKLGGSSHYHISTVKAFDKKLEKNALEKALREVVNRHEVLRTVIKEAEGAPYQEILAKNGFELEYRRAAEKSFSLSEQVSDAIHRPFDLETDHMIRGVLYELPDSYLLTVVVHHIAADGWSMNILIDEVLELYASITENRPARLAKPEIQYKDYAVWQQEYLHGEVLQQALAYWENQLNGIAQLDLPLDFTRPKVQSNQGDTVSLKLDNETIQDLERTCREAGVTLYMYLLTVFKILLYKYSGQTDVCVISPLANRTRKELEGLIGFFTNTIAMRSNLDKDPAFIQLLHAVKETTLTSYQYQDVPFESVVERISGNRDLSMNPLSQVMFVLQNTPQTTRQENLEGPSLPESFSARNNPAVKAGEVYRVSKFDLTANIAKKGNCLHIDFEYSTDLFKESTVSQMIRHYGRLIESALANPNAALSELVVLTDEERVLLNRRNTNLGIAYPDEKNMADLFYESVDRNPDGTAVSFGNTSVSYKELDERSSQLARYLVSKGVGAETFVGICLDRSIDMIVGILAIVKAGGTYVPVDPDYPQDRIDYILADAGLKYMITKSKYVPRFSVEMDNMICMDEAAGEISGLPKTRPDLGIRPGNALYIIYTSGSTGRPKGVVVEHQNVVRLFFNDKALYDFNADDVWTLFHSFCFDFSVWEMYGALLFGGKLVIVPAEITKDPKAYVSLLSEHKVTVLNQTPGAFYNLQDDFLVQNPTTDLRYVIFGGEALAPARLANWYAQYPDCRLINMYGITETTVHVTYKELTGQDIKNGASNIGKAIPTLTCLILDKDLNLVPDGVQGEIYVGGAGLARGYLNRPALTAERFIDNPVKDIEAPRLYKTGDLGRRLPDGNIEYLGRIDKQVKIRGFRIELSEIEWTLNSCESVKQSVVLARKDRSGNQYLVAYIVAEAAFDKKTIHSFLKAKLPRYMVPAMLIEIDEVPLTSNGKVDIASLPEPAAVLLDKEGYVKPENGLEEDLAAIWDSFLNIGRIGSQDDFFALGGHSLMASRVVAAVNSKLNTAIEIKDLFLHPTISELAALINPGRGGTAVNNKIPVAVKTDRSPLSYSQERLWFIDQQLGSRHYHTPYFQTFNLELDIGLLEEVIRNIIERHEVLRTVFKQDAGIPYLEVRDAGNWKLAYEGFENQNGTIDLLSKVSDEIHRPFDLESDYMLRAKVFKMAETGYLLVASIHHIAMDGWSIEVLQKEVAALYNAKLKNYEAVLEPLELQYSDYAAWQKTHLSGKLLEEKLEYWQTKLEGVSPLQMPLDFTRPGMQSMEGDSVVFEIGEELSQALQQTCKDQNVTLFTFLLSAFNVLLSRCSNQTDICVGSPVANRNRKELENMIGFFANTIALRSDLGGNPTFAELLAQVKTVTLEALSHQDAPFEKVVERVIKERDLSRSPIFQVLFNFQHHSGDRVLKAKNPDSLEYLAGLELELLDLDRVSKTSRFDLALNAVEQAQGIRFNLEFCKALFKRETIERLSKHFTCLLNAVVNDPYTTIQELKILDEEEAWKLKKGFNNTCVAYPENKSAIDLFEEQAAQKPDQVAIVHGDRFMSYKELDEQSSRLAYWLRSRGVAKSDLVGICMDRSIKAIVSILAVLKTGGAYIPMDPAYPQERLHFMVEDAQVKMILSQKNFSRNLFNIHDQVVELDEIWSEISTLPLDTSVVSVSPNDLMYVIYTSGSTGKPKGVMVEHTSNVNMSLDQIKRFGITQNDKVLQFASLTFDASVSELFMAFYCGAALVLADREVIEKPSSFVAYMEQTQASVVTLPPAYLKSLEDMDLSFLRCLITAGEAADPEDAMYYSQFLEYHNAYGPTECAVCVSSYKVNSGRQYKGQIPIGDPLANMQVYIFDEHQNLCPVGVPGELCVSGTGLARGYLNRPELTEERFVAHPFDKSKRMYKTGDIARWLPDGNLEYYGRKDDQVKLRGFRIELGEVEATLNECVLVRQSSVQLYEDRKKNKRLVAYVVPKGDFDKEGIEVYLKLTLPHYMVPALLIEMEQLPVTSHGKINKKLLPDPGSFINAATGMVSPQNDIQEQLAEIWSGLLNVEEIGIHHDFFELGGHSLLAMRVVAAVKQQMDVELNVKDIFTTPTIEGLSLLVEARKNGLLTPPVIALKARPENIPLSFSQEYLWVVDKYSGSNHYHMPFVQAFGPGLDVEALEHAIREVVDRHEVLRTNLKEVDGQAYQSVMAPGQWTLQIKELEENISQPDIQAYVSEDMSRSFNLYKDHMLRATLYRVGNTGYVLVLLMHHIAADAWSVNILTNEILEHYNAKTEGRKTVLPIPEIQYSDYAVWQRENFKGDLLEEKLGYWGRKLKGVQPIKLPLDFTRPNIQSTRGKSLGFPLSKDISDKLNRFCRKEGVTPYMFLLSIFKILMYRYSGQEDICIGSSFANRGQKALENLIGFFVNTVAMRGDLSGNPAFNQFLNQVKETVLEAYNYQDTPIDKVIDRLVEKRDMSMNPLFQVLFTVQNAPGSIEITEANKSLIDEKIDMSEFNFQSLDDGFKYSKFDMTMNVTEHRGSFRVEIEYCTDLFLEETIRRLGVHYQNLITSVLEDRTQSIAELQLITPEENDLLLNKFNFPNSVEVPEETIIGLFENQVRNTPDNTALICGHRSLSYVELDTLANRLANHLKNNYDIQAGDFIGLKLKRSEWPVVSLLAILKNGAAYVPVDVGYPEERIRFIEEDSNCKTVIDEAVINAFIVNQHQNSPTAPEVDLTPSDKVYMIYTSGSTGLPKGVPISNKNLVNYIQWAINEYKGDKPYFSFPFFTSLSFDLTQTSILLTLLTGGKLSVQTGNNIFSTMEEILTDPGINALKLTPAHVQMIYENPHTTISTFILGGEELLPGQVKKLKSIAPSARIFNEYGPTETTIGCTCCEVVDADREERISIGRPIANTRVHILDNYGNLLPPGMIGELCIGGIGVAGNYWNRPELSRARFVDDPFSKVPGEKLYRTGDLVKWDKEGKLQFYGRQDDQVKVRGFRIELGEIMAVLDTCESVGQNVVLAKADHEGNNRLIAYVVPVGTFDKAMIQTYLSSRLPEYMIPSVIVELKELPLTRNGKVDKKTLMAQDIIDLPELENDGTLNEIELQLLKIWKDVLNLDAVNIRSNFFDLGGHSLLAIKLIAQVNKAFAIDLDLTVLFDHPTIEELGKQVQIPIKKAMPTLVKISEGGRKPPFFCVPGVGGHLIHFHKLGELLNGEMDFYGFQAPGLDGITTPLKTVSEMAAAYIEEMIKVDPVGPYFLGGYSFGAKIAYEMLLQMEKRGLKVARLIIIDTYSPDFGADPGLDGITYEQGLASWAQGYVNRYDKEIGLTAQDLENRSREEQIAVVHKSITEADLDITDLYIKGYSQVWMTNSVCKYYPDMSKVLDLPITVFQIDALDDYGWQKLTSRPVETVKVPGLHWTVLKEQGAYIVARKILDYASS